MESHDGRPWARRAHPAAASQDVGRTIGEHRTIVRALEVGDADIEPAAMTMHIGGVEQLLRTTLAAQEAADGRAAGQNDEDADEDLGGL